MLTIIMEFWPKVCCGTRSTSRWWTSFHDSSGHRHLRPLRIAAHPLRGLHEDLRHVEYDPELDADGRGQSWWGYPGQIRLWVELVSIRIIDVKHDNCTHWWLLFVSWFLRMTNAKDDEFTCTKIFVYFSYKCTIFIWLIPINRRIKLWC